MKIRVQKLSEAPNCIVNACPPEAYVYGGPNNLSVPVDYTIEGFLLFPIKIGEPVVVNRTSRNGVQVNGIFKSTEVVALEGNTFQTKNSIYKFEYIE